MKSFFFHAAMAMAMCNAQTSDPRNNVHLPPPGPDGCANGYLPGVDVVLYTVPYTYAQVLSIIGNYTNLTWSGSPENSVTTNNSEALITNDWTPGTARFYTLDGASVVETITEYRKPSNGPYVEIHTLAPIALPALGITAYAPFDGQVWQPVCNGRAVAANFTTRFCSNNPVEAAALLHQLHMQDAQNVSTSLGGKTFTSCQALSGRGKMR